MMELWASNRKILTALHQRNLLFLQLFALGIEPFLKGWVFWNQGPIYIFIDLLLLYTCTHIIWKIGKCISTELKSQSTILSCAYLIWSFSPTFLFIQVNLCWYIFCEMITFLFSWISHLIQAASQSTSIYIPVMTFSGYHNMYRSLSINSLIKQRGDF